MLTYSQQKILSIVPRCFDFISLLSCGYIVVSVVSNSQYRTRLYHRLMLGMAITMSFHMAFKLWGTAAVPEYTDGVFGARGTTGTCTAQGFVNQLGFVSLFYYCELSIVSFVAAVKYDFSFTAFPNHVETLCHFGAFIFPLGSAIYLAAIEALNFNGYTCWVASVPWGCGGDSGIECERGPDNITALYWWFGALPTFVVLLLPTALMIALNVYVRRRRLPRGARTVVFYQAGTYLVALYFAVVPTFVDYGFYVVGGKEIFWLRMVAICQRQLVGFYILLAYLRLRIVRLPNSSSSSSGEDKNEGGGGRGGGNGSPRGSGHFIRRGSKVTNEDSALGGGSMTVHSSSMIGRSEHEVSTGERNNNNSSNNNNNSNTPADSVVTFSIFDGTSDPSSPWNDFIFEGEDSEQELDDLESRRWESVVQR